MTRSAAYLKPLTTRLGEVIGTSAKDDTMDVPKFATAKDSEVGVIWLIEMARSAVGTNLS